METLFFVGDKMKNIKGIVFSVSIIIILTIVTIFSIQQGRSQATSTEDLESKVHAELEYLDNKLLSMMNGLNNILLRNYVLSPISKEETT